MSKILVIDRDIDLILSLDACLRSKGHDVTNYQDMTPSQCLDLCPRFDLILMAIDLTAATGIEICQKIRQSCQAPILLMSQVQSDDLIVAGLEAGADDFMTKPFTCKHMVARIEAHLRREKRHQINSSNEDDVRFRGAIRLDLKAKKLFLREQEIPLTKREYKILELLSRDCHKIFSKEEIYEAVYPEEANTLFHAIPEYIYQIRSKFAPYHYNPIKTVRGWGYQWQDLDD